MSFQLIVSVFFLLPIISTTSSILKINSFYDTNVVSNGEFGQATALYGPNAIVSLTGDNNGLGSVIIHQVDYDSVLLNEKIKLTSDQNYETNFGMSVGLYNDSIMVGAPNYIVSDNSGAVYTWMYDNGMWKASTILLPSDSASGFGGSVTIDSDIAVIGADLTDSYKGVVYIFKKTSPDWSELSHFTPPDATYGDHFGISVSKHNSITAIGAYNHLKSGAVFVYSSIESNNTYEAILRPPKEDSLNRIKFGYSVGVSGNTVVVGAYSYNNGKGAAYVFVRSDDGNWGQQAKLEVNNSANDQFGIAVSIYGDTILVGASRDQTEIRSVSYLFVRFGTIWVEQAKLSDPLRYDYTSLGKTVSLAIYNEFALVGAPKVNAQNQTLTGAGYFQRIICSSQELYGPECKSVCQCINGICNAGLLGDGSCKICDSTHYGRYCNNTCTCPSNNGVCSNDPLTGDGTCITCNNGYYGNNCENTCTCVNGICENSINGTGICKSCDSTHFGKNCDQVCSCVNGQCDNDPISGNGKCIKCNSKYYGELCDKQCSNSCRTCLDDIQGTGECTNCNPEMAGAACNISCPLPCKSCNDNVGGDGLCLTCFSETLRFGAKCELCGCVHGKCDSGLTGTGKCLYCTSNYYGQNCTEVCKCNWKKELCNDGVDGDGSCFAIPIDIQPSDILPEQQPEQQEPPQITPTSQPQPPALIDGCVSVHGSIELMLVLISVVMMVL